MNLNGKTAVVTGSTKGIGRAIAEALVRAGMNVCVSARKEDEVKRAVDELSDAGEGRVAGAVCDVRVYEEVQALLAHAVTEVGGVDVLVNNAGIGLFGGVEELKPEDFRAVVERNQFGVVYGCREVMQRMKERGGRYI